VARRGEAYEYEGKGRYAYLYNFMVGWCGCGRDDESAEDCVLVSSISFMPTEQQLILY
jgi:hypothetical protein